MPESPNIVFQPADFNIARSARVRDALIRGTIADTYGTALVRAVESAEETDTEAPTGAAV